MSSLVTLPSVEITLRGFLWSTLTNLLMGASFLVFSSSEFSDYSRNLNYICVRLLKKEAVYGKKLVGGERPTPHPFLTAAVGPKPELLPPGPCLLEQQGLRPVDL